MCAHACVRACVSGGSAWVGGPAGALDGGAVHLEEANDEPCRPTDRPTDRPGDASNQSVGERVGMCLDVGVVAGAESTVRKHDHAFPFLLPGASRLYCK